MARPLVIAHRGASGREAENSLAAFRLAADLGADAVELDIHATADGRLVVHHDEMIGHHVAHCSLAEVRSHLPTESVPTPAEALRAIHPDMTALVRCSRRGSTRRAAVLDAAPRRARGSTPSTTASSTSRSGAWRCAAGAPAPTLRTRCAAWDADADTLWQHCAHVDERLVTASRGRARSLRLTVDEMAEMRWLLALGVDGICTNHPDRARGGRFSAFASAI
jgi:glycerophosphoryl diester phosphodiesterase